MNSGDKIMAGIGGYVEAVFKVQMGCVVLPICKCTLGEKRGAIMESFDSIKNKGISGRGGGDLGFEGGIDGIDKKVVWEKSDISIIRRCIRIQKAREGIGRPHGSARGMDKVRSKSWRNIIQHACRQDNFCS